MLIDFKGLIATLDDGEIMTLANEARPGSNYIFNSVLPEVKRRGYSAKGGSMTIRATMAKLVGLSSPYPKGGAFEQTEFEHKIAKMAIEMDFPEEYLRELRELVKDALSQEVDAHEQILETLFNFTDKLLVQPHLDTAEWLRGQALVTGAIDWQSDDIHLEVDYGIPSTNFLPTRTGTDAYDGTTSKFWADVRSAQSILNNRVVAIIAHSTTVRAIMDNPNNNIRLIRADETAGIFVFQKYVSIQGNTQTSEDTRDTVTLITYDDEGEVYDSTKPGTGETVKLPFMPVGAVLFIGAFNPKRFIVGAGSTPPVTPISLGYTHVGPTEEGDGRLGRWANLYVPEGKNWMFVGHAVTNCLPVIEAPDRLVVAKTDITT